MPGLSATSASTSASQVVGAGLDIVQLFHHAHWIVQGVMILLAVMFVIGLYIIIYKTMYLRRASAESERFLESFWKSRDIEQIYKQAQQQRNSPVAQMFVAGYTELAKISSDDQMKGDKEGALSSIERSLRRAQITEMGKLDSMIAFLATTGSAAPFIGLFGTVVGILFAFVAIGESSGAATLKVVGPHIAEALFATAIGLVAAIPAVMAYNYFMRRIRVQRSEMETFEQDYLNIIKRHFLR